MLGLTKKDWALSPRPDTIPAWDSLSEEEKDFEDARMAVYAAQVDRMDQAIGRVLAKVKELGQEENTLVLFLSDNGASPYDHGKVEDRRIEPLLNGTNHLGYGLGWANVSETPFRHYKRNMFKGGSCTPCIAHWLAGLKQPGSITEQRAHIIDLMATIGCANSSPTGAPIPKTQTFTPVRSHGGQQRRSLDSRTNRLC